MASYVAARVAAPRVHRSTSQTLHLRAHVACGVAGVVGHLLGPGLRVAARLRRRVLGLASQASRAPLGRFAHALESPLVHDILLVTQFKKCDFYAIGRARRSRPLSSSG